MDYCSTATNKWSVQLVDEDRKDSLITRTSHPTSRIHSRHRLCCGDAERGGVSMLAKIVFDFWLVDRRVG